jgi:hypothetical protein
MVMNMVMDIGVKSVQRRNSRLTLDTVEKNPYLSPINGSKCPLLLTMGFGPQAIGTKICTRLSGLGPEPISLPASGLVRRLFLRHPRAWCGSYFSAILGLGGEAISPPSSGLVRKLFPNKPLV